MDMDLESYLKNEKIWHKFIEKAETIRTADAAAASGVPLEKLTKTLVLLDEANQPILAIIPGDCKLSFGKLRKATGAKSLRLSPFSEAESYSGYPPGGTPMLHHKNKMKVVVSSKLSAFDTIYGGGGSRRLILELKTEDVVRLNNAVVADITE